MTTKTTIAMKSAHNFAGHFILDADTLDMPAVLLKFQQFMKEEFNEKDKTFLEQHGRLVFLSFLTPILNGKGHSFKEVQTSEEKRLDIIATYKEQKYIIELKRWGVREYWYISPKKQTLTQYENRDSELVRLQVLTINDVLKSLVIEGFEVPLKDIFE